MLKDRTRYGLPAAAAAAAMILLLIAGSLAACTGGIAVTPLPPHMNQRGAR